MIPLLQLKLAGAEEQISTSFSCISWDRPIRGEVFVRTNEGMEKMRIHSQRRSALINYIGPNPVVFFQKKEGEGQQEFKEIAQVYLNPLLAQPLLLFVKEGESYTIVAIEDSFEAYPVSSYRFYNFTDKKLLAKFGDDHFDLAPQETVLLKDPFTTDTEFPVGFVVRSPDGIHPLYSNMWSHLQKYRYLILISESETRDVGPMKFRILSDYERMSL
ncbi:hypothetical protein [Rubellicoccus peritrichatus]|uniref:Uncharacterized protein n=1 Tax=Rubellicoccus peritrichatus TaxID=3080537 RepID=A0AAQ3L847_9BACT|nr:hypothetical protein [Puniceicoccus sp. CR14]WOO41045.1 hypothetical protein RZN69_20690 [Puniceicoccus sp. CR14]